MRDICGGYIFCATMQLRTPLRVLLRHCEIYPHPDDKQPRIAKELWEGVWVPKSKTFMELGINLPEFPLGAMASQIGSIPGDGGPFLAFLISVRVIVETAETLMLRRENLGRQLDDASRLPFVNALGGKEAVLNYLFPPFIDTIRGLSAAAREELRRAGLLTPVALDEVATGDLLKIKGLGPSTLKTICQACATATDRCSEFVDGVNR